MVLFPTHFGSPISVVMVNLMDTACGISAAIFTCMASFFEGFLLNLLQLAASYHSSVIILVDVYHYVIVVDSSGSLW
jgi:hypothetical protein